MRQFLFSAVVEDEDESEILGGITNSESIVSISSSCSNGGI